MLDKTFRPAEVEAKHYADWESSGSFAADVASNVRPYTIMMPPPNVTGSLHIGHALTFTLQDVLVRYYRMTGRDVLWQPGTDHAGIATQMVVERQLEAEGETRRGLGREAFLEKVWDWKKRSGGTIRTTPRKRCSDRVARRASRKSTRRSTRITCRARRRRRWLPSTACPSGVCSGFAWR